MAAHHTHLHLKDFVKEQNKLKSWATYISVGVAILLIGAKVFAWFLTNSLSLLSSLTDSVLDLGASLLSLIAVYHAMQPPDDEHRFGHGKIESLAAVAQSLIIALSAIFVLKESMERVFVPEPIHKPMVGLIVMGISVVLTLGLLALQRYVIQKTHSIVILADSMHYKADLYLNLGVIVSLALYSWLNIGIIDSLFGALIALYIIYTSYKIAQAAFKILLDSELSDRDRTKILNIIQSVPKIKGCVHLKTRSSGTGEFIQGYIMLPSQMTIHEAQTILNTLEKELLKYYPNSEALFYPIPWDRNREKI